MNDLTGIQVGLGVAGTVSVGVLISYLVDVVGDYWPTVSGRWAIGAVDVIAALTAAVALVAVGVDWLDPLTWGVLVGVWLSLRTTARGTYELKRKQWKTKGN